MAKKGTQKDSDVEGTPKSMRLPSEVWEALHADAVRCKRSDNKQLHAILATYYNLGNVELREMKSTRLAASGTENTSMVDVLADSMQVKEETN